MASIPMTRVTGTDAISAWKVTLDFYGRPM